MPAFKQKIFGVARCVTAYLVPGGGSRELQRVERLLRERTRELEGARRRLADKERELERVRARTPGSIVGNVRPENVVWIFGSARTGSTWLMRMMESLKDHTAWREPLVGELFGRHYYKWVGVKHSQSKHFILGSRSRESWSKSIRNFVLHEANARFPQLTNEGYLVIREPNGSVGAPLLMEALPESRMILLIRDPRDVVASSLDALKEGSWLYERRVKEGDGPTGMFDMPEEAAVEKAATKYSEDVGNAREAYEAHDGPKVLVRYEELRADALGTVERIYSTLGIPVDGKELARAVEKHSWDNIPEEDKGEGKFHRKATPGSWREDLTEEQTRTVERITAPLLRELYPA